MAELRQNTWTLDQWYDQDVAGNVSYTAPRLLYTVGQNDAGELGQNVSYATKRSSPVQLPGTNWKYVDSNSTDDGYCMALKTDGTLWGWGRNENGEQGRNDTVYRSSPTQVGSDTTWSQVTTCGRQHGCVASKTDGTLWSWGSNTYGRLGTNQAHPWKYSSPGQVPGTTWRGPVNADRTAFCSRTDDTMWGWGWNAYGRLGIIKAPATNFDYYSSPIQIPGGYTTAVTGSPGFTAFLKVQ